LEEIHGVCESQKKWHSIAIPKSLSQQKKKGVGGYCLGEKLFFVHSQRTVLISKEKSRKKNLKKTLLCFFFPDSCHVNVLLKRMALLSKKIK